MKQSKYGQYRQRGIPHQKRTIRIPGAMEDDGKYFRCWYCGFPGNRIDRNALGDGDGLGYAAVSTTTPDISIRPITTPTTVMLSGSITLPPTYQAQVTVKNSGCAFCGCMNYR